MRFKITKDVYEHFFNSPFKYGYYETLNISSEDNRIITIISVPVNSSFSQTGKCIYLYDQAWLFLKGYGETQ